MNMLDIKRTKVVANPIPMAFSTEVVTAKVGQVPKTSTNTGFSLKKPLVTIDNLLIMLPPHFYWIQNLSDPNSNSVFLLLKDMLYVPCQEHHKKHSMRLLQQ